MTHFTATIVHHSISRARVIKIDGELADAKRAADEEFGNKFIGYKIVINEHAEDRAPELAAYRIIGRGGWISA